MHYKLEITTIQICNMGCTYCFESTKGVDYKVEPTRLDFEPLIDKIDGILESEWLAQNHTGLTLDFWGGEPTLNYDLMEKLLLRYLPNEKAHYHMYSNGYDIKPHLKFLQTLGASNLDRLNIQISYDGAVAHDRNRKDKRGRSTEKTVRENIYTLAETGVVLGLKTTLVPENFEALPGIWEDYKDLYDTLPSNCDIHLYPTIDYHNERSDLNIEEWKSAVKILAGKEYKFYQEHGHHLMSWFGGQKRNCSAGKNISAVDVFGNSYLCHGALYEGGKEDFKLGHITQSKVQFVKNLEESATAFALNPSEDPLGCKTCEATMCQRCHIIKHASSSKTTFFERWYDNQSQPFMCYYFKEFGKIDRALQALIKEN